MYLNKHVIAIVPARCGSKGIRNKNMQILSGVSLIGLAGACLNKLMWLDAKIITTDSEDYCAEGKNYGLDAPFIRPAELSSDTAGAVETITHALLEAEKCYRTAFDVVLIIEPTSPLRQAADIEKAAELLINNKVDSVVTVSEIPSKFHPKKVFEARDNKLHFYEDAGSSIVYRQSLDKKYWRNGICYALTRECLLDKKKIITDNTMPLIIDREVVNIDEPIELAWADFLIDFQANKE
ncbi:acylneuraminate cytidylyltransferase family protein [Paenibacillus sp. sptzw28]|uniref:acylneuraminate cytidylyltransferase family protein n=1 Tax=Paenibacillus sp. sptzw28 TaxID=715179 RepID=UPI001C6E04A4|nr:acylneuraminate cytidylyltransferase family protein [Paenibacillus sp. sptzw28]QYR19841.1 acylneuraminate cytidylyltransferase family protein [Paenibacillus sp. sptzw28]